MYAINIDSVTTRLYTCNMGSFGNMFDIKTLGGEISIYAIGIYVDVTTSVNYEIYTSKLNSFNDDNGKLSLLPMDISQERICDGAGRRLGTPIRDFAIGNLTI